MCRKYGPTMTDRAILEAIMRRDPDSWETVEPTDADRTRFALWVIEIYGREAWRDYHGIWDE